MKFGSGDQIAGDRWGLWLALLLGFMHGLIYVFIIPPWQHYDEPNHFEYSWLIARRGALPTPEDVHLDMRRSVAVSMVENGFFRGLGFLPEINSDAKPAWIGPISQLTNPPLYYLIASLPIRLSLDQEISTQLYAARLVSFLFYLACIWAAWGVMQEVAPHNHILRVLVPVTLALLPGFTDSMTAVNNDAIAIALVSICLWCCVRMVLRGITVYPLVCAAGTAALSLVAKETGFIALPLFLAAIILALFRGKFQWIAWSIIGVVILAIGAVVFSWGDAAGWYRSSSQTGDSRSSGFPAVLGDYVFVVDAGAQTTPPWVAPFFQSVTASPPTAGDMKVYTLGGWLWADQSATISTPSLGDGHRVHKEDVQIGVEPTFHAISVTVNPQKGMRLWVGLDPNPSIPNTRVYYDGLVLVEGDRPVKIPPVFSDSRGESGSWAGEPFRNLLRNASAERAGIRIAPWIDDLGATILPDQSRPSLLVSYALDWHGAGWNYRLSLERLLHTFWATFGWGHVYLLGHKPYRWLAIVSFLGIIGSAIWFTRRLIWARGKIQWDIIALFGLLLVGSWGSTLTRAAVFLGHPRLYIPVARYAYPAIIPTITVLCLGWMEILKPLGKRLKFSRFSPIVLIGIWIIVWVGLDIYSLISIQSYYGR